MNDGGEDSSDRDGTRKISGGSSAIAVLKTERIGPE